MALTAGGQFLDLFLNPTSQSKDCMMANATTSACGQRTFMEQENLLKASLWWQRAHSILQMHLERLKSLLTALTVAVLLGLHQLMQEEDQLQVRNNSRRNKISDNFKFRILY